MSIFGNIFGDMFGQLFGTPDIEQYSEKLRGALDAAEGKQMVSQFQNPTEQMYAANLRARELIMDRGQQLETVIYTGELRTHMTQALLNVGMLTHLAIFGDVENIARIKFNDLNNNDRINCAPASLPHQPGVILIPIANVIFAGKENFVTQDLRGAMYMNVVSAAAYLDLYGTAEKIRIVQYHLDMLPVTDKGHPILPILDLSVVNKVVDKV